MGNPSYSVVNPAYTMLSPCRVKFKSIDLGGTLGNVTIAYETEKSEIKMDQLGTGPIDRVISKQTMKVSFEIAEIRFKDNWKVCFPHMTLISSGGNKAIYSDSQIGRRDQDDAGAMILHPLALADADLSGDHLFYKMISDGASEIIYGPGEQARLKFSGIVLPDFSVQPVRYYFHGDPALGLIAASAGAPSFVGTGNGTCTLVSVGSKTMTENVVITCIGTNGSDKSAWKVVGSMGGAYGTVELTGGSGGTGVFVSDYINFTLTDGGTDFVVGDAFTIATVGANYV